MRELTEEKTERELQKPSWFEINRKEFEELTFTVIKTIIILKL